MGIKNKNVPVRLDCIEFMEPTKPNGTLETVALLIDVSGSMNQKDWPPSRLQGAKDATMAFLNKKMLLRPRDRVGIVTFGDDARIVQRPLPVASHFDKLGKKMQDIRTSGVTSMGAGLLAAGKCLSRPRPKASIASIDYSTSLGAPLSRRIVLLTDGAHNSGVKPGPIAKQLKRNGVCVDCIGVGGKHKSVNEGLLREMASRDGNGQPRYWYIGDRLNLIRMFEKLATGLRGISA